MHCTVQRITNNSWSNASHCDEDFHLKNWDVEINIHTLGELDFFFVWKSHCSRTDFISITFDEDPRNWMTFTLRVYQASQNASQLEQERMNVKKLIAAMNLVHKGETHMNSQCHKPEKIEFQLIQLLTPVEAKGQVGYMSSLTIDVNCV